MHSKIMKRLQTEISGIKLIFIVILKKMTSDDIYFWSSINHFLSKVLPYLISLQLHLKTT